MKATTNRRYFNELMKNPLFFMEQKYESIEKQNLNCIEIEDHYFYKSAQTEISAFIFEEKIVNEILHLEYVLFIIAKTKRTTFQNETYNFHVFSHLQIKAFNHHFNGH